MVVVTLKFYQAQKQSHLTRAIKDRALIYNIERNMWIKCPVQWVAKFKHILHQNKAKQFYFLNQKELYFLSLLLLLFYFLYIYLFLDSLFFFFVLTRPAKRERGDILNKIRKKLDTKLVVLHILKIYPLDCMLFTFLIHMSNFVPIKYYLHHNL